MDGRPNRRNKAAFLNFVRRTWCSVNGAFIEEHVITAFDRLKRYVKRQRYCSISVL